MPDTPNPTVTVHHNEAAHRFEAAVEGQRAVAEYQLADGVITFTHTLVPEALEGRGIASQLIKAGLAMARERGLRVIPRCRFVAAYMRRHADTQLLLAEEGRRFIER